MKDRILSKQEVEPGIYKLEMAIIHTGSCQCKDYKDCDCANKRGTVSETYTRYSNGLLNKGGNLRLYKALRECKISLAAHPITQ